jgi:hypothetical protein
MTESQIQKKISDYYSANGWVVVKLMKTNWNGCPDLMLLKDGRTFFIEVKTQTGVMSKLQAYRHKELRKQGFDVFVIDYCITKDSDPITC